MDTAAEELSLSSDTLDLGDDHYIRPLFDRGVLWGFSEMHLNEGGGYCVLTLPVVEESTGYGGDEWELISITNLTLYPSVNCPDCKEHGWIVDGQWGHGQGLHTRREERWGLPPSCVYIGSFKIPSWNKIKEDLTKYWSLTKTKIKLLRKNLASK